MMIKKLTAGQLRILRGGGCRRSSHKSTRRTTRKHSARRSSRKSSRRNVCQVLKIVV